MARIVVSTVGTLGEFLPFRALARALQSHGHEVVLAVNPALLSLAAEAQVRAVPCGPTFGPDQMRRAPAIPGSVSQRWGEDKKAEVLLGDMLGRYRQLLAICADADLLVAHSLHFVAVLLHDRLRLPWVCVGLWPGQFMHDGCLTIVQDAPRADLNLFASSRVFSAPSKQFHHDLVATGFWFDEVPHWQPTPELRRLVEGSDRPLVLCLGGTPGPEAAAWVRLHAEAAVLLGKKLVVQSGWADLHDLALPETSRQRVVVVDFVDHDWLLPRAEAVIHPGGIGVTARALRHGCPQLLEPRRKDQFWHAAHVHRLGAGHAMDPRKLTAERITRMLAERVLLPSTSHGARDCAKRLGAEDGVEAACARIEGLLVGSRAAQATAPS